MDQGPLPPGGGVSVAQAICACGPLLFLAASVAKVMIERSDPVDGLSISCFVLAGAIAMPLASLLLLAGYAQHARHRTDWAWVVKRALLSIVISLGVLVIHKLGVLA